MVSPTTSSSSPSSSSSRLETLNTSDIDIQNIIVHSRQRIKTMMLGEWNLDKIGDRSPSVPISVIFNPPINAEANSEIPQGRRRYNTEFSATIKVKDRHQLDLEAELDSDLNLQLFNQSSSDELNITAQPDEINDAALVQAVLINSNVTSISAQNLTLENAAQLDENLIGQDQASASASASDFRRVSLKFVKAFSSEIEASQRQDPTSIADIKEGASGFSPSEMKDVAHSTPGKKPTKRKIDFSDTSPSKIEKPTIKDEAVGSMKSIPEEDEEEIPRCSVKKVLKFDSPEKT